MIRINLKGLPGEAQQEEDAAARLAQVGVRASTERIRVLSLLMKYSDRAWTVHELCRLSNDEEVDPAFVTRLYRTLGLLEKTGVVKREVHEARGRLSFSYRFAGKKSAIRLQCRSCSRLVAADNTQLRAQIERAGIETGLPIASTEVLVLVTCSRCVAEVGANARLK